MMRSEIYLTLTQPRFQHPVGASQAVVFGHVGGEEHLFYSSRVAREDGHICEPPDREQTDTCLVHVSPY